jgi:hypothetical protein
MQEERAGAAELCDADREYAYLVAHNQLGDENVEVLNGLTDDQVAELVTAGRAGDMKTVNAILSITG